MFAMSNVPPLLMVTGELAGRLPTDWTISKPHKPVSLGLVINTVWLAPLSPVTSA